MEGFLCKFHLSLLCSLYGPVPVTLPYPLPQSPYLAANPHSWFPCSGSLHAVAKTSLLCEAQDLKKHHFYYYFIYNLVFLQNVKGEADHLEIFNDKS